MEKLLISFFFLLSLTVSAQNTEFWGMTSSGGVNNRGVIFKTDGQGSNLEVQHNFTVNANHFGSEPGRTHLVQANDGMLYGMTYLGGISNSGVLFQYDPGSSIITKKVDFTGQSNGAYPYGSLLLASDGLLYGMTREGGAKNKGVLFQYNPTTGIFSKKIEFDQETIGSFPLGSLIQGSDGKLYGLTVGGGVNNQGVLFQYDFITNSLSKKIDFKDQVNGAYPQSSLVLANNGKMYGMTPYGGINGSGLIFEYDLNSNTLTKKIDFYQVMTQGNPLGSLTLVPNGDLYGMVQNSGIGNFGVIFKYNPTTNTFTKKLDLTFENGYDPQGSFILANDGHLYATTTQGGVNNLGVLFKYDFTNGVFTKKFDFTEVNGSNPLGTLMQSKDGKIYGLAQSGGSGGAGVLFEYDIVQNLYSKRVNFEGVLNGANPFGSLTQANNGKFYGFTTSGGTKNLGVIFEYDPIASLYSKKVDFTKDNGARPYGSLAKANDGTLYGVTFLGGANNLGVLFKYDPVANSYTKKLDFAGTENGANPEGSLIAASDGNLYGVTTSGGINSAGVLFQYNPTTNQYNKKYDFTTSLGYSARQSLLQTRDGNLFGLTDFGGTNSNGTLFQYDLSANVFSVRFSFDNSTSGYFTSGSLIQGNDDKLYGMMSRGGANQNGVLFQYNPTSNLYVKKIDFSYVDGAYPLGSLMQASDGKLYGMTSEGGSDGLGILFQFDPVTNLYAKKIDFSRSNGAYPRSTLIEISNVNTSIGEGLSTTSELTITPNPVESVFEIIGLQDDVRGYEFFDLTGRVVKGLLEKKADIHIAQVQQFQQGIYLLRIEAGGKVYQIKFLKN